MIGQPRLVHLKQGSGMEPKCGAADATNLTNWVRGASFDEVYVPADIVGTTDLVCRKCQEEALRDDSGSDDEVVADDEASAAEPELADADPALVEVSDRRLLKEIARRLGDEDALAEEQSEKSEDRRN